MHLKLWTLTKILSTSNIKIIKHIVQHIFSKWNNPNRIIIVVFWTNCVNIARYCNFLPCCCWWISILLPHPPWANTPPPHRKAFRQIRWMRGWYASYWNAILLYIFLLIKINVTKRGVTDHLFLFIYVNHLLPTCGSHFNIQYFLFTYSKPCQQKQVEPTTCFYLLTQIDCWLHVLFVLIWIICLFIY